MTITLLAPDGVAVTAQQERQARAAGHGGGSGRQLGGRSGFRVGTPSTVLAATGTTWTLGPCAAMLDPGATAHQGMYGWSSDANVTGAVTAADATNPRKDIVYIQVNDSSAGDGSGATTAPVLYLAGTPGVTPSAPALPARSFLVGTITVPQAGGGSPTVELNKARYVAAGGVLPVDGSADRATIAAPYLSMDIQRVDLKQVSPAGVRERWNGTNWDHFGHAEWTYSTVTNISSGSDPWGPGALTFDSVKSTDSAFVAASTDTLTFRDAGVYALNFTGNFNSTATARSWLQFWDGVNFYARTPVPVGEIAVSVALPNFRVTAGGTIKMAAFFNTTANGGTWGYSGRVTVTRIG